MIGFRRDRSVVEDAVAGDAAAMADIHGESFSRGWSAEEMAALMADHPVVQGIVMRRGAGAAGRRPLTGFVLVRIAGGEAEILTVAVEPASRGRGHGRRLMAEACRRAYRDRAEALFLEVDEANRAAIALYRSLGFETVGQRTRYYQGGPGPPGNALVMRLRLR